MLNNNNYKIVFLLSFLLYISILPGISQTNTIDSLKYLYLTSSDSCKSKVLLSIAREFRYTNYDSAILYGNKSIDYALFSKDKNIEIESLVELAFYNKSIGNWKKSLVLYNQAKQMCKDSGNKYLLAKIHMDLERYYKAKSDFASGISSLDTALSIININNFSELEPMIYHRYGSVYISIQDFSIAKYYADLAINASLQESDKIYYIKNIILLGSIFYSSNDLDSSFYYFNKALWFNPLLIGQFLIRDKSM